MEKLWTKANIITAFRVLLLYIFIGLILSGKMKLLSVAIVPAIFFLDSLDGYIARKFKEETKFGSLLDVMGDRIIEMTLWVFFLYLEMVPLWAPLIIILRGLITDTIRAKAYQRGKSVYGMIETKIGKLLVSSRISREISGLSKLLLFTFLSISYTYNIVYPEITLYLIVFTASWNILRGIPVILEAKKLF